jgi:small-conductance mechanosensitive channel
MLEVVSLIGKKSFEYESNFDYLLAGLEHKIKSIDDDPKSFSKVLIIYQAMNEYIPLQIVNFVKKLECPYSLFHHSNEWGWMQYPQIRNSIDTMAATKHHYGGASRIFRNYWNPMFDYDSVTHLPIFWQNGFLDNPRAKNVEKLYKTAFVGSLKNDRKKVIEIMQTMGDCFVHESSGWMSNDIISVDKQAEAYSKSVLCPCPMGGCHPEVFRMCEILESKSIPVIVEYFDFEYHNRIYGYASPIPKIKYWEDLPKVYKDIEKQGIQETTQRIQNWYQNWKVRTKNKFQSTLLNME